MGILMNEVERTPKTNEIEKVCDDMLDQLHIFERLRQSRRESYAKAPALLQLPDHDTQGPPHSPLSNSILVQSPRMLQGDPPIQDFPVES